MYKLIFILLFQYPTNSPLSKDTNFPVILYDFLKLQDEDGFTGNEFEFWVDLKDEFRYSVCPLDAIPFAWTGNNGIHFAFLTDFGRNKDLNKAPIICVAPTYDPAITLVANNIHDFLGLLTSVENAPLLADRYKNQNDFEEAKKDRLGWYEDEDRVTIKRKKLISKIRRKFNLKHFDNAFEYMEQIRRLRSTKVDHTSKDELGIFKNTSEDIISFKYSKDPKEIMDFLGRANKDSRLLFYRNCTYSYILSDNYDAIAKNIIEIYLKNDGYKAEADRLKFY